MLGLFASTLFLSAFLLFMIQPLTGRLVLPVLGGSAAVWTTCLVFFQAVLLAAYGWAHLSSMLPLRLQVIAQVGLLGGVWWMLPAAPVEIPDEPTVAALIGLLVALVGLPAFAVAVNASLLQRWYAQRQARGSADPYFLYAFSNAGSFTGLLAYPLIIEPWLALTDQRWFWGFGCAGLAVLVALCGLPLLRKGSVVAAEPAMLAGQPIGTGLRLRWFLLSLVPASLLAGLTAYLSTELLPLPLLWVVPLAVYLLTFVTSFGGRVLRLEHRAVAILPVAAAPLILWHLGGTAPFWALLALHLVVFAVVAALCHGQLADSRPSAAHLTSFYWWLAAGGVAGGAINALLAPFVLRTAAEYPLMLVAASVIIVGRSQSRAFDLVFGVLASLAAVWTLTASTPNPTTALLPLMLALASRVLWLEMRVALACLLIALVGKFIVVREPHQVLATRSVFAALRVVDEWHPGVRGLIHGSTVHGLQALDVSQRREPRSYFARPGPIGQVVTAMAPRLAGAEIAVVGLGAGELAAYASEGQMWTFYEIDPQVVRIAQDPALFTYLPDAAGRVRTVLGDGRKAIASDEGRRPLALLVLDAFSSDSIPLHLLTLEAFRVYRARLAPDGIIAVHISNRFVDLRPVLSAAAAELNFDALSRFDRGGEPERGGRYPSHWVVMGPPDSIPTSLRNGTDWRRLQPGSRAALWTDERATLVTVLTVLQ